MTIHWLNKACVALLLLGSAMPIAGRAASADPASGLCPPLSPDISEALRGMRQTILTPGAVIDFAKMTASPGLQAARKAEDARKATDWAYLCRYRADNAALAKHERPALIFIGASITENWRDADPDLFQSGVVNRGIGGQTTSQLLLRFYQDVIALRPHMVHIMGGANDIAGNSGRISDDDYKNNMKAMVDIARANGVKVVIGSIPPTSHIPWQPSLVPAPRIQALNEWLENFAAEQKLAFADYADILADDKGGMPKFLSSDGVHPNRDGYKLMRPVVDAAIATARMQGAALRSWGPDRPRASSAMFSYPSMPAGIATYRSELDDMDSMRHIDRITVPFRVTHSVQDLQINLFNADDPDDQYVDIPPPDEVTFTEHKGELEPVGAHDMVDGHDAIANGFAEMSQVYIGGDRTA